MIMQLHLNLNWNNILHRKHQVMIKSNMRENKGRVFHKFNISDKCFILHNNTSYIQPRKLSDPGEGPL